MHRKVFAIGIVIALFAFLMVSCAKPNERQQVDGDTKPTESTATPTDDELAESAEDKTENPTENKAVEPTEDETEDPGDEIKSDQIVFEVYDLYVKAKEAYGWFDLTTIPHDTESYIESEGIQYYEVILQPSITSKQALADYLNQLFTEALTAELMDMASSRYVEHGGKLYVMPADRGTDITKGDEMAEVTAISDDQIELTVTVEVFDDPDVLKYEQFRFYLEHTDNGWRFRNFQLVR
jgi:hypothetical protein